MMNTYPENDYRNYLMHWGKGGESKNHKYVSRKMGKNGKWIYTYATDAIKGAGREIKRRYDLASARNDIQRRIAGKHTSSTINELNDQGRVSDNARYHNPNFGKESEWSKENRTSTKAKKKINSMKSAMSVSIAKKAPKLDVALQKSKKASGRISRAISSPIRKLKTKRTLSKARKDIKRMRSDRSEINGFPKSYNKMMAEDRITPQNKWMTRGQTERTTRMTRRRSTW